MMLDFFVLCLALKQDLARKHKEALQSCRSHNLALLKSNQQSEQEVICWCKPWQKLCSYCLMLCFSHSCVLCCQALEIRVREEQRMMDKKIVAEIDQKVIDQQNTLEKAGVPGFYITTNPQVNQFTHCTVKVKMHTDPSNGSVAQTACISWLQSTDQQMAMCYKSRLITLQLLCFTSGADNADESTWIGAQASTEGVTVWYPVRQRLKGEEDSYSGSRRCTLTFQ